ncbi:MAG: YbaB/EbfC family nucleoid-associated protein [Alphaproteobacteria bacterium]|nr:YbaB/EbfC family nucleoid-associated protein [Alphaproteobacteria bacterium]
MDMKALMEQAKGLQAKVSAAQDSLSRTVVKGIAAGGMAIVEMTGKYELVKLTLSPDIEQEDLESMTAIISAAFNDAKAKADATIDKVMSEATAGMPLPQ